MQELRVRHITRYRYARPVRFGEHRVMLRPRDDADQTLLHERLIITPEPIELRFGRDDHGNWFATARFASQAHELCFKSEIRVARPLELRLTSPRLLELPPLRGQDATPQKPADPATAWARRFLAHPGARPGLETIAAMSRAIRSSFAYRRRLEHGVQSAAETLSTGSGACRDFAVLLVEAARALGLEARFASGYVHTPALAGRPRRAGGGHTHAWAYVRTPDHGWIDVDPTAGTVGSEGLVRIAVADQPTDAIPIQGVYFGDAAHYLGMDVKVEVRADVPTKRRQMSDELLGLQSVA